MPASSVIALAIRYGLTGATALLLVGLPIVAATVPLGVPSLLSAATVAVVGERADPVGRGS